ncbi:hypothetical protein IWW52_003649, partial [Coemansia sp. RSA 2704]
MEEGKCTVKPWDDKNYPEKDVTKDTMRCRSASTAINEGEYCDVAAGSTFSVHMHESGPTDRVISESHKGPYMVYMAPAASNGEGNVWFSVLDEGWNPDTDVWGVDTLIKLNGKLDIQVPPTLAPGQYIVRAQVIALHEADRVYGEDEDAGAEFFPSCVLINVSGTGTEVPPGVAIPGAYDKNDPGVHFNLWDDATSYEIPGPAVY